MEVKGTAVIPVVRFVQEKYKDRYDEWIKSLSADSANIMKTVMNSRWYPLKESIIEPTQKVCDLFYAGKEAGALEMGSCSADYGLKGVYKLFVQFGSPSFIISKSSQILPTYYKDSVIEVFKETKNSVVVHITKFPDIHRLLELRIAGWQKRSLEICGCKNVKMEITKSLTKGDPFTELVFNWD